jgi:hypothetical protein
MVYTQTFLSKSKTATDDNPFTLVNADTWVREGNIHVTTNNAKYGDRNVQDAPITAGDVIYFQDFNLLDIFFKNAAAGSNTVITFSGTLMTQGRLRALGVV